MEGSSSERNVTSASSRAGGWNASDVEGNALLAAIRREVEASEQRLATRMSRVERQTEHLRQSADNATRLDERMAGLESARLDHDRRFAELGGTVQACAGELQSLVKRVSNVDMRLGESYRDRGSDSGRGRVDEFRQELQTTTQNLVILKEDVLRRVDERLAKLQASLDGLGETQICHGRRLDVTEAQLEHVAESSDALKKMVAGEALARQRAAHPQHELQRLEQVALEAKQTAEQAACLGKEVAAEVHFLQVRGEEHELRISALTGKSQATGQHLREVGEYTAHLARSSAERLQALEQAAGLRLPEQAQAVHAQAHAMPQNLEEAPLAQGTSAEPLSTPERPEPSCPREPGPGESVDRRINALEEKLALGSGSCGRSPPAMSGRDGAGEEAIESRLDFDAKAPEPGRGTVQELQQEICGLSGQVAGHARAIEEMRTRLMSLQKQAAKATVTLLDEGAAPGVAADAALRSLATELHALTECLASSEAGPNGKERKAMRQEKGRRFSSSGCWPWLA